VVIHYWKLSQWLNPRRRESLFSGSKRRITVDPVGGVGEDIGFYLGSPETGTPLVWTGETSTSVNWRSRKETLSRLLSHSNQEITQPQVSCFITYTDENVHRIVRENMSRSPLYKRNRFKALAPYCPSFEDKVVKFPDKPRHQLFLEPEGLATNESLCHGLSTSMPVDVQLALVRSIRGLEKAEVIRPGYAIEYDYVNYRTYPSLEQRGFQGLYHAGQINGTTGYEERRARA